MKDERNVRHRRAAYRRWQPAAILLAAVLMVISVPYGVRSAYAVDLDQSCSLTVNPGNATFAEDLETANVVVDLYRVADATAVKGFDTYDWTMNEPFSTLAIDKEIDSAGWKTLAQQAADIVLGTAPEGETAWDPTEKTDAIDAPLKSVGNAANTEITGLQAGLYLVIAHGSDVEKYAAVATDDTGAVTGSVTIANSHTYEYSFAPELISLPTKDADEAGVISTANPGDWIYNASVTLKPSQKVRVGNLVITKTLDSYAQRQKTTGDNPRIIKDPATFIFEVVAYAKEGSDEVVFNDYVSIVFDNYGSKSVLVKDLPVDSYVVVKEVYSGRIYTTDVDKNTTILADQDVGVDFENDYDNREPGGGSVTNNFSYTESDGWVLKQVTDDTEYSIQNPINTFSNK